MRSDLKMEIKDKNLKLFVEQDESAQNQREDETLGHIIHWHRRYNFGERVDPVDWKRDLAIQTDETLEERIEYWEVGNGWKILENKYPDVYEKCDEKVNDIVEKSLEKLVMLPLYLLDHSGLHMCIGSGSHPPDSGGWDSGQVGFIYTTKEEIRKWFNIKYVTKKYLNLAEVTLRYEIEIFDKYLTGDVYHFTIEEDGEIVALYKTKKSLKEAIGKPLNYKETSLFGADFKENGRFCVVGPSPYKRNWYATVTMENGFINKVE